MCEAAAATWASIDDRQGQAPSRLAITSIRTLATTQISVILAAAGKRRWCELAVSSASAAEVFLQIFPAAAFVCVHRGCADTIATAISTEPWGLAGPAMWRFNVRYPGNSVAAAAAYWVYATEQLLAFEKAHSSVCARLRYEDFAASPKNALAPVRSWLHLQNPANPADADNAASAGQLAPVPMDLIPGDLRVRIASLARELGFSGD